MITTSTTFNKNVISITDKSKFTKRLSVKTVTHQTITETIVAYSYFNLHNSITRFLQKQLHISMLNASEVSQDLLEKHEKHVARINRFKLLRKIIKFKRFLKGEYFTFPIAEALSDLIYIIHALFSTKSTKGV